MICREPEEPTPVRKRRVFSHSAQLCREAMRAGAGLYFDGQSHAKTDLAPLCEKSNAGRHCDDGNDDVMQVCWENVKELAKRLLYKGS